MNDWWQTQFPRGRQTVTIRDSHNTPVKIAYGEKGSGRPLVLVHGLGQWSTTWSHTIDALAPYFRVICIDNKGYGYSDKPIEVEQSGYQVIELKRILDALCEQPPIVITESLWGTVALGLAERFPEAMAALVVIGAPVFPTQLPTQGLKVLSRLPIGLVRWFDRLRLAKAIAPLLRWMLRQERQQVIVRRDVSDETIVTQAYPYIQFPNALTRLVMDVKLAAQEMRRRRHHKPNVLTSIEQHLSQVNCPTLVIWGRQDAWFPVFDAKRLAEQLPNARLVVIDNCGHDTCYDCYNEMNSAILTFLKNLQLVPKQYSSNVS